MTDFDDNIFDEFEEEPIPEPEQEPEGNKSAGNRTFVIAAGALGAIFLLALIALIVYAVIIVPQRNAARLEQAAQINAQNTATSVAATEFVFVQQLALTPSETPVPEDTEPPTPTSVVVFATETPEAVLDTAQEPVLAADSELNARTATVAALLTMAAGGTSPADLTATSGAGTPSASPTALPTTGFADEVGLPALLGIAVLLLGVIVLARRLRIAANA